MIDEKTGNCTCQEGFFLTVDGCKRCGEAIAECGKCEKTANVTQVLMGNSVLQHSGDYLKCVECSNSDFWVWASQSFIEEKKDENGIVV
jgi:hypothetical protein